MGGLTHIRCVGKEVDTWIRAPRCNYMCSVSTLRACPLDRTKKTWLPLIIMIPASGGWNTHASRICNCLYPGLYKHAVCRAAHVCKWIWHLHVPVEPWNPSRTKLQVNKSRTKNGISTRFIFNNIKMYTNRKINIYLYIITPTPNVYREKDKFIYR